MTRHGKSSKQKRDAVSRGLPGAFEGETVTRRRMMTLTANAAGGITVAAMVLPALGFVAAPVFEGESASWQNIGPLDQFTETDYRPTVITIVPGIGEAGDSLVYVRKHDPAVDPPPKDRYDHVVAISSRCAHIGCPVRYVAAAQIFDCPCHGGVYNFEGVRIAGPPPRPLDRFYTAIKDGDVYIGPRYSVNNQLRRFSPRDPGEPLDGIGQFLYPARFTTPPAPPGAKP